MDEIGVGLVGAGLISDQHALAFQRVKGARVLAVADPDTARARKLADTYGLDAAYDDARRLLERPDVDMICIGAPNFVHRDIGVAAAEAGKHIVCEKPLARTMAEADEMIAAARRAGVKLMYAELICFAPRYVRAKELMDEGAFGRVFQIRHGETHYGPHSDWFWQGRLVRRRRDDGHGLPQRRGHPLAVRQAGDRERHRDAGHVRARRPHRRWRTTPWSPSASRATAWA